jgi:hypothetical protein
MKPTSEEMARRTWVRRVVSAASRPERLGVRQVHTIRCGRWPVSRRFLQHPVHTACPTHRPHNSSRPRSSPGFPRRSPGRSSRAGQIPPPAGAAHPGPGGGAGRSPPNTGSAPPRSGCGYASPPPGRTTNPRATRLGFQRTHTAVGNLRQPRIDRCPRNTESARRHTLSHTAADSGNDAATYILLCNRRQSTCIYGLHTNSISQNDEMSNSLCSDY